MTTRRILLAAALLALAPARATATDAPHDASVSPQEVTCKSCHSAHGALGGSLTSVAGNANLCQSCHVPGSAPGNGLGLPWKTEDQAVPGSGGLHHRWDASATNATYGALPPRSSGGTSPQTGEMAKRLPGGNLECSTCHDQHASLRNAAGQLDFPNIGSARSSIPAGADKAPNAGGSGLGTMAVAAIGATAQPRGYLVAIATAGAVGTSRFKLSSDNGKTWFGCSTPTTYDYLATYSGSNGCQTGAGVALSDPAVTVTFKGSSNLADQWKFYVAYPMLRASNADDAMCEECHRDRAQHTTDIVQGLDPAYPPNGTTMFSHPVGLALSAAYDRTVGTNGAILDADGSPQGSGSDGNASNDLRLVNGVVRCTSCHAPHNASSNSLSVDLR